MKLHDRCSNPYTAFTPKVKSHFLEESPRFTILVIQRSLDILTNVKIRMILDTSRNFSFEHHFFGVLDELRDSWSC